MFSLTALILVVTPQLSLCSTCLDFKLASYYTSGMVLQSDLHTREARGATVWGWGCSGARLTISEAGGGHTPVTSEVSDRGWWSAEVRLAQGGPYNLTLTQETKDGSRSVIKLDDVLAGDVWICSGSDDMALPMGSVNESVGEMGNSLNITRVRYTELRPTPAADPQMDIIGGLRYPWTGPSLDTLPGFSATCWMFARAMSSVTGAAPVGIIGAYVNGSDIRSWSPGEEAISKCDVDRRPLPGSKYWNGMISPLSHLTALGVILSEGENDLRLNKSTYSCLLNRTVTTWMKTQKLDKFGIIGLGSNIMGSVDNSSWAALRLTQLESLHPTHGDGIPATAFIPSHDLADPGHRISRHKFELASRLVNMTMWPQPPILQKACYVYIYIALRLTEKVHETLGHTNRGFSSCCRTEHIKTNTSCLMNGPNGDISILTSTENGYLFAQECKTHAGEQGVVTEIYHGWAGGYPYLSAPLYGAMSGLPAATSWARVLTDDTDPMCVH